MTDRRPSNRPDSAVLRVVQGSGVVQDLGRLGAARVGLSVNGAADQYAARAANALVGKDSGAALLEFRALGTTTITADRALIVAATGAAHQVSIDGLAVSGWQPLFVPAGARLTIDAATHGVYVYLAVVGTVEADLFLGSCAPDHLLGTGRRLGPGDEIRIAGDFPEPAELPFHHWLVRLSCPLPATTPPWNVSIVPGPDEAGFAGGAAQLDGRIFTVSPDSDAVGLRARGETGPPVDQGGTRSKGIPVGAVEIPSAGEVIVLQRARGISAGYAIPAVVPLVDQPLIAQARPGDQIVFRLTDTVWARRELARQRESLRETTRRARVALSRTFSGSHPEFSRISETSTLDTERTGTP